MRIACHPLYVACRLILFLILPAALTGCKQHPSPAKRNDTIIKPAITISDPRQFSFRRSYSYFVQFSDLSEEEIDKEVETIRNSNPLNGDLHPDTVALERMHVFGIVDEKYSLYRNSFLQNPPKHFELQDQHGRILDCSFIRPGDSLETGSYKLDIRLGNEVITRTVPGYYGYLNGDISYRLLDLIPGGFPEIIILHEYYVSNGDNSDLYVYEIKSDL